MGNWIWAPNEPSDKVEWTTGEAFVTVSVVIDTLSPMECIDISFEFEGDANNGERSDE